MLLELHVENFALIDRLDLALGPGLNVLTGETGAGKSIIVDAIEVALGGRASADYVRSGEDKSVIQVLFDINGNRDVLTRLEQLGLEPPGDGLLLLSREVLRSGRSSCRINGRLVTAAMGKEVTQLLVDIHGQHEHQSLVRPEYQLELLDYFGGPELQSLRGEVKALYERWQEIKGELRGLQGDSKERARRMDLLRFQVEEIDAAGLRPGEEEELAAERQVLAYGERLKEITGRAYALLHTGSPSQPSLLDLLGKLAGELREAARYDPSLDNLAGEIQGSWYQLAESARDLRRYEEGLQLNPQRLAEVEQRLQELSRLRRKYGDTIEEILRYRQEAAAEMERLTGAEETVLALEAERGGLEARLKELAAQLSGLRQQAAGELCRRVVTELAALGLERAQFIINLAREDIGPRGQDRAEFLLSSNEGEPVKPLGRVASGGEISRVMLGIKTILAHADAVPTVIFDEIDAGVGGRATVTVAERLAVLASKRQVICITHLPQIASVGDHHFKIFKVVDSGRTKTLIVPLGPEERAEELARMMGGDPGGTTLQHAREMLEAGARIRCRLRHPDAS